MSGAESVQRRPNDPENHATAAKPHHLVNRQPAHAARTAPSPPADPQTRTLFEVPLYIEADLAMKERALAHLQPPGTAATRYRPPDTLMRFLQRLRTMCSPARPSTLKILHLRIGLRIVRGKA